MAEPRHRILIADDREENRYILSRILSGEGYQCSEAQTAAQTLQAAMQMPDLIILDVQLPDRSGFDICRHLKSDSRTSPISILQISASFLSKDDRVRALEAGADGYLTHPIDRMVLIATVRALLRLRRAEADARNVADQWQTTFDSLSEGLAIVDGEGSIVRWNNAFREICGSAARLEPGVDAEALLNSVFGMHDPLSRYGPNSSGELSIGRRTVQLSVTPLSAGPAQGEKIIVFTDITDRKLSAYALATAEKLAATGKLANAIAHEINNPLEALTNLLYLAQCSDSQTEVQGILASAAGQLERISRITKQTLSFHRDTEVPVEIEINELLREVIALLERSTARHRVQLICRCRSMGRLLGFPGQLNQVFINLIRNAAEAAPSGSDVTVRVSSIERAGRRGTRVTVHDRGSGIPAEIQERIFDPFFTTKDLKGSGLGLWVSRSLIARHNGTIRFRSSQRPGKSGTSFEVFLPDSIASALEPRPV
jgi:signal transduction histidine kinase